MVFDKSIKGNYISLRSVTQTESDLSFIVELRTDSKRGRYIHETPKDIEFQREWLQKQQKKKNDYYFMIVDSKEEPVGTVSIYNINIEEKTGELGRWVSVGNAIENLESVYLLHKWAFEYLNLEMVYTKTLSDNQKVVNFWRKFGAKMEKRINTEDGEIAPGEVSNIDFYANIEPRLKKMLRYREA